MKKPAALFIALALMLGLCACAQNAAATWQEQYDLGVRYLSEGNYREAIIAFNAAIEIDPKRADAYLGLADAYTAQGDTEQARQVLEDALAVVTDTNAIRSRLEGLGESAAPEPTLGTTVEPTQEPATEPTPDAGQEQSAGNGSVAFSGSGRDMSVSLTWPGLPEEVIVRGSSSYGHSATFAVSFSDGIQTFCVWMQVYDFESDAEYMTAIPNGDACTQILTVACYDPEDPAHMWWSHLADPVTAARSNDTITWSFTVPDAGFSASDIRYIGYRVLYYTQDPDPVYQGGEATFAVENGELTYLNNGIVEDLGFLLSDAEFGELYIHG